MQKSLDQLIKENNGYLVNSIVSEYGYSRQNVSYYAKINNLEKITSGVYITNETWPDDLYITFLKNKSIVYSYETALYLHGLMDKEPSYTDITVIYGYNATHLKKRNFRIHTVISELYETGKSEVKTPFGNSVNAYDMERTICDIIKNKDKIDKQIFTTALNEYVKNKNKRIPVLLEYAEKYKIINQVKTYLEVLL